MLSIGDRLGDERVVALSTIPYEHDATYDILPGSTSRTYFAAGALVDSTLTSRLVDAALDCMSE